MTACQPRRHGGVAAERLIEEQVEAVLVEQVERVGAAEHAELGEAHARGRHAVDAVVVEEAELVHAEAVQVAAAVIGGVQVDLVEAEEEVLREAGRVLQVVLWAAALERRRGRPRAPTTRADSRWPRRRASSRAASTPRQSPTPLVTVSTGATKLAAVSSSARIVVVAELVARRQPAGTGSTASPG